jgi:ABC-type amino acid transport substrate-binding protein
VAKKSTAKSIADLGGQKVCATKGSISLANVAVAPSHPIPVAAPYWTDCLAAQDPETKLVGPQFTNDPYGLAIFKGHPDFVRFVNAVLAKMRADGQWAASYPLDRRTGSGPAEGPIPLSRVAASYGGCLGCATGLRADISSPALRARAAGWNRFGHCSVSCGETGR